MSDRRDFLQLAALMTLGLSASLPASSRAADASASQPRGRGEIARYPLGGDLAGKEAVLVDLVASPGAGNGSSAHRHPGFVLGYVIEGEYAFSVNDEESRVIRAGETFFEKAGDLHSGSRSASVDHSAHLLAFMVVPAGAPLTLPE